MKNDLLTVGFVDKYVRHNKYSSKNYYYYFVIKFFMNQENSRTSYELFVLNDY